jgi:Nucleotidyl transferase AbiEii toxin, Type IV TA system
MTRLRDRPADLAALASAASSRLGLPVADVEKDVWLVELLRSIARPVDDGLLILKGGTSLSKAYAIIERFSEDVDVLVAPAEGLSIGRRDRLLKGVAARVGEDLRLTPSLVTSTTGVKRDVIYEYPAAFPDPMRLTAGVLLEMGIRGGPEPHELREVTSYLATAAIESGVSADEFEEFAPVFILTLRPERTLVEKLALLHDHAARLDENPSAFAGQGRHVYDVYRLLRTGSVRESISTPGIVAALAADAEAHSQRHGFPSTPRPESGFAASPVWAAAGEVRRTVEEAYAATRGLIWGPVPTLDECRAEVAAMGTIL